MAETSPVFTGHISVALVHGGFSVAGVIHGPLLGRSTFSVGYLKKKNEL